MAVRQTTAGRIKRMLQAMAGQEDSQGIDVQNDISRYNSMHDDKKMDSDGRKSNYAEVVNTYYNLATDFYEWGWGQSFHFANKLAGESFASSIFRHEYYLALRLGIEPSHKVLDCGCGIGGPLRNIGRFTDAYVTGVTLNQYQVNRGNALCAEAGLAAKCKLVKADFHHLPFPDGHFDACYSIEACCHSPDKRDVYREIYRCLKPGGKFISYEWCLTDKYDANNPAHVKAKKQIEEGDGLPDMTDCLECDKALVEVGFNMVESRDTALDPNPHGEEWWVILAPSYFNFFRLQFTPLGTYLMNKVLNFMELIRLAPKGSGEVREMLRQAQLGLVAGGRDGYFTPMYMVLAQKPL
eukprot:CAMPEP_0206177964 /NCGR_PEP_ID=MMETSP1474-20131121/62791_1 /ASSEMBLY_ACC=CAM_ASM_001110 /TAXON_ID=97495 /ORGANISM="Imantonia sp., Strain RCC918" /LENGTH=352 /DNA_ID=CAMNT_0053590103 /DNA_START=30 /DNA_END=1088 /DNA_ORIENTATION=-